MENIQKNIGSNLKDIRRLRGLSLDGCSALTGVSKAMLGQIERGESNPTVTTLWKIAKGLQVSFSSLITEDPSEIQLIELKTIEPVVEADGKYRVYTVFPFDPRRKFEVFTIELEPGYTHCSQEHSKGVEEYITVMSGRLELEVNGQILTIESGNSIKFAGDQHHAYKSAGHKVTRFQAIMYYP
ncbi:helix-turn-helix domain-containing protein [Bacillus mesophilum]|uniref:Helix-turn-helix domain-containing protein n=1 Tax=Bacillus mesophilum TaxID=1071718 RepID=A0A7V7RJE2_9BACI|nr:XRE family transcriptional regulator [Bacillus mesophilum]KAB2330938.1 helix-turn-helix domain-containing protein [Bacillus mesophilum]